MTKISEPYEGYQGISSLSNTDRVEAFKETIIEMVSGGKTTYAALRKIIKECEDEQQFEIAEAIKQVLQ